MTPPELEQNWSIDVEGLGHRFSDGTWGLREVNLRVSSGSLTVIAGPNGSGKTTLMRHFNGLLMPTEGRIAVGGISVVDDPLRARMSVGLVFQNPDHQIVGEAVSADVAFGPENLGLPPQQVRDRVDAALRIVGLDHMPHQRPHLLSGGEKRRLAIAGILAMEPQVVVLDEPFVNLDYPGTRQVLGQIVDLHRRGRTVIVATHELEKIIAHADRLVLMHGGRVFREGFPEEVFPFSEEIGVRRPCAVRHGRAVESWLT